MLLSSGERHTSLIPIIPTRRTFSRLWTHERSARADSHSQRLDPVRVFASQQVHLLFFWPVTFAPSSFVTSARGKVRVYICVGVGGLLAERGANDRADYSPEPELSLALPGSKRQIKLTAGQGEPDHAEIWGGGGKI